MKTRPLSACVVTGTALVSLFAACDLAPLDSGSALALQAHRQSAGSTSKAAAPQAEKEPAPVGVAAKPADKPNAHYPSRVDEILARLEPRRGETPEMMFFRYWGDNPFVETASDPLSTFAVDVDTASYTLLRSYLLTRGLLPPPEAIRTEEFINYFKAGYTPPPDKSRAAFSISTEIAPSPFARDSGHKLLRVGVKGFEVPRSERKACALVFVVDTSGSMRDGNRLELVKDSLRLLVKELDEGDTIGIVAFDSDARVVLDPRAADHRATILHAIDTLEPGGSTNADAGLCLGYQMAADHFIQGGANRVLLLSDGVANTGSTTDYARMLEHVREQRERGIYLTTVGVGMGNHNDYLLEQLADKGDGQCVYVDRLSEARRVFVDNLTGTLQAIAKDVKIQVEFDRDKVSRYRQLGYENRAVADSAFRDDTVDAGEIGSGHEVTCLYELECKPGVDGALATVRVRYRTIEDERTVELEHEVMTRSLSPEFCKASPRLQLAACVAEFAEVLRDSYWARGADLDKVADRTQGLLGEGNGRISDPEAVELVTLMRQAAPLVRSRRANQDQVTVVVDSLKENYYLRSRVEQARSQKAAHSQELSEIKQQSDALRRRLEGLLAGSVDQ